MVEAERLSEYGTYFIYVNMFFNCELYVYFKSESYITYLHLSLNDLMVLKYHEKREIPEFYTINHLRTVTAS